MFRKYTEASIRSDWRRKDTFKVEKLPIPCKAATILRECCHVPVHLALGTGRQAVAVATRAHGTPGQQVHAEHLALGTGRREVADISYSSPWGPRASTMLAHARITMQMSARKEPPSLQQSPTLRNFNRATGHETRIKKKKNLNFSR